jgi:hypothetical protein
MPIQIKGKRPNPKHRESVKSRGAKDPAAVSLGRKGGKKGGPARAKALSGAKRTQIAKHSANARWGNKTQYSMPAHYLRTPKHH